MDFHFAAEDIHPLLVLAIVLLVGLSGGWIARRIGVPGVTGNIVAGVILAQTVLHGVNVPQAMQPLSTFAISLIAVSAGSHFSYRRIHNSLRRIVFIAGLEVLGAFVFVFLSMILMGASWPVALLLSCLATSTAPATTVALISENRARGPFVKTLLAVVSLNSSACILLFALANSIVAARHVDAISGLGFWNGVIQLVLQLLAAVVLGIGLGVISTRLFSFPRVHDFSILLLAILIATGLSFALEVSPLLTCLFYGAYLGNSGPENERQLRTLEPIEPLLYTAFFTLAGVSMHLELLPEAGLLCFAYVLARGLGKGVGAGLGARLAGSSPRIVRNIPFGFVPQAGVALGLIVTLEGDPRIPFELSSYVATLVLAAVTINEIIGPFFTRFALNRAGESGLDRPRLVEFLDEEFIMTDLQARDKWEAIDKLMEFYARTHRVPRATREAIQKTIIDREIEHSTAIGLGAAIPHGRVAFGRGIGGVMGIAPEGIEWDSPDGEPVRLIVLIVTPKDHERRHLDVLGSVTAMISDSRVRDRLIASSDPNDAWEVIESKESRNYNYFLEEEEDREESPGR